MGLQRSLLGSLTEGVWNPHVVNGSLATWAWSWVESSRSRTYASHGFLPASLEFFICNPSVPFLLLETSRGNFFLLNLNKMKRSLICHMLWRLWGGTVRVTCRPGFRCGARLTRSCFCFRKFLVLSPLLFFLRKVEVPPTCSQSSEAALELSPETSGDRAPL